MRRRLCEMLHFALSKPYLRWTMRSPNITWSTRDFFTFYIRVRLLSQCRRRTARRSSVCGPGRSVTGRRRPWRPPSPVSPHPGPGDGCPLSWLHRPARNHGSMARKSTACWSASHVGSIIAPPSPLGPRAPRGSPRGPCPSDAMVVLFGKGVRSVPIPSLRHGCIDMGHRDGPRTSSCPLDGSAHAGCILV
jgi:hypothetical protein